MLIVWVLCHEDVKFRLPPPISLTLWESYTTCQNAVFRDLLVTAVHPTFVNGSSNKCRCQSTPVGIGVSFNAYSRKSFTHASLGTTSQCPIPPHKWHVRPFPLPLAFPPLLPLPLPFSLSFSQNAASCFLRLSPRLAVARPAMCPATDLFVGASWVH